MLDLHLRPFTPPRCCRLVLSTRTSKPCGRIHMHVQAFPLTIDVPIRADALQKKNITSTPPSAQSCASYALATHLGRPLRSVHASTECVRHQAAVPSSLPHTSADFCFGSYREPCSQHFLRLIYRATDSKRAGSISHRTLIELIDDDMQDP